ncbi:anthranilate synthase component I [Candidatus Peregrinibacteria bacterium RIFOXYB2_FULL_32_7]|nr:MAG: anthranilate synthase component I [Candidatus Peregrinibacteria bacterium RIFOXYB2_FULL_32_7]
MNIFPKLDSLKKLKLGSVTHVPVIANFVNDTETPISIYKKITQEKPYSFLLESGDNANKFGRYSFISLNPKKVFEFKNNICSITENGNVSFIEFEDPLKILEKELKNYKIDESLNENLDIPILTGGFVGFFSYEACKYFEKIPLAKKDFLQMPDCIFALYETIIIFDHFKHKIYFIKYLNLKNDIEAEYQKILTTFDVLKEGLQKNELDLSELEFTKELPLEKKFYSNFTKEEYLKKVEKILFKIKSGETYQLQLSQRLSVPLKEADNSFDIYRRLRLLNGSPYMYFLKYPNFDIVGASPETLVRVENNEILVRPIAGTRKRTGDPKRDKELEKELSNCPKEQAEHMMLVDLARNDVSRIAEIGSVETSDLMHFERFSHVVHLVSDIRGKLKKDKTIFDAFKSIFPHGTVTGAPKIRTQEIIAEMENERRGIYTGAVGYFGFNGNMDTAIAIRTMLIKDKIAYLQAAGGIVYDSIPEMEYKESMNKMKGSLSAIL